MRLLEALLLFFMFPIAVLWCVSVTLTTDLIAFFIHLYDNIAELIESYREAFRDLFNPWGTP